MTVSCFDSYIISTGYLPGIADCAGCSGGVGCGPGADCVVIPIEFIGDLIIVWIGCSGGIAVW